MNKKQLKRRITAMITGAFLLVVSVLVSNTASAKVYQITFNDHNPRMSGPAQAVAHWAKKVEEKTRGRVKMNVHFGGILLKNNEAFRGVQKGMADGCVYVLNRKDGFVLNNVITLPFMGWPDYKTTARIYEELLTYPEIKAEWKGVLPIAFSMNPPTHIHNTRKEIHLPSDLKGMKFHGAEYALIQIMAATGATPIQMDISDMYMSIDRGLIDGVMNHFPVLIVFGVLKSLPYHTIMGEGGVNMTPQILVWNERSWKRLPKDIQKGILAANVDYRNYMHGMTLKMIDDASAIAKREGHKTTVLTDAELKQWRNLVKEPIHDKWMEEAESKGLSGKKFYKIAQQLIQKYKKQSSRIGR